MAALMIAVFILSGCSESPNSPKVVDPIIGEWEGTWNVGSAEILSSFTIDRDSWDREDVVIQTGRSNLHQGDIFYVLGGFWERISDTQVNFHITFGWILGENGTKEELDKHIFQINPLLVGNGMQFGNMYYERK